MRVLLIGLDGMAPGFLDHWADRGRLPFLRSLRDEGTSGVLESTVPPYTPTAWTSIVTGVNPGRHGIFGFTRWTADGREELVDAETCGTKTIWDLLSERDRRSVVVNVPITYPPRPIGGVLVSGMGTPSGADDWAYPAGIRERVLGAAPGYVTDVALTSRSQSRRGARSALGAVSDATDRRLRAAAALLEAEEWDFAMVVLEAPDRLQHLFWRAMSPGAAGSPLTDRLLGEYERIDAALARIVERAERDGPLAVLVVSDHGFQDQRWELFLNNHLARSGLLTLSRKPQVRLARRLPSPVRHLTSRLYRTVADPLAASHTGAFDWERTVAFAGRAYEQGVYVRGGTSERDRTAAALLDLSTPDGEAAVERLASREEVYRGPHVPAAPDLFPLFRTHGVVISPGLAEPRVWRSRSGTLFGAHHPDGVLLARGPGIRRASGVAAQAQDVAPTVYRLLGDGIPEGLDGRPIPGVGEGRPVPIRVELERRGETSGFAPAEEREIVERLRALGYLE